MGIFFIKEEKNQLSNIFSSKFFDFSVNINESWYNQGITRQACGQKKKVNKQMKQKRTYRTYWKIQSGQYKIKRTSETIRPGLCSWAFLAKNFAILKCEGSWTFWKLMRAFLDSICGLYLYFCSNCKAWC